MRRLRALWRRLRQPDVRETHCAADLHRDTVEAFGGYVLRARCLDCGRVEFLGWVVASVSQRRLHPWERPDA